MLSSGAAAILPTAEVALGSALQQRHEVIHREIHRADDRSERAAIKRAVHRDGHRGTAITDQTQVTSSVGWRSCRQADSPNLFMRLKRARLRDNELRQSQLQRPTRFDQTLANIAIGLGELAWRSGRVLDERPGLPRQKK